MQGKAGVRVRLGVLILLVATVASVAEPAFASVGNLNNLMVQATVPAVVVLGMTFVIVGGGVDLSVGSIAAFAGIVGAVTLRESQSASLMIGSTAAIGIVAGIANGLLITRAGIPPFLATLGMMGVARGGAFLASTGRPLPVNNAFLDHLYGGTSPIAGAVLLTVLFAISGYQLLHRTAWGLRLFGVGGNEGAAALAGLNIKRYRLYSYAIAGFTAATSGLLVAARLSSAQPLAGSLYELDAIAAAVLGGASLAGGRGDMVGSLLGVLLVVEIRNAVSIVGLPSHAQPAVIGFLLLLSVALDVRSTMTRTRKGKQ